MDTFVFPSAHRYSRYLFHGRDCYERQNTKKIKAKVLMLEVRIGTFQTSCTMRLPKQSFETGFLGHTPHIFGDVRNKNA